MASTQTVSPWAHGIAVFAGVMMIIGGAFQALQALAAIVNDKYQQVLITIAVQVLRPVDVGLQINGGGY